MRFKIACIALAAAIGCARSSPTDESASLGGSATDANALLGRWRLVELGGKPALSGAGVRVPYLVFSRDSLDRVVGETGCNHLSGRFAADGAHIRFSQLISTRAACGVDEGNQQESRFFAALEAADRYTISGETLLFREGGTVLAKFVKGQ
jgi:heat shock protein HslJ